MEQTKLIAETIRQVIKDVNVDKIQGATISQGINERGLEQLTVNIEFKYEQESPEPKMDMVGNYYQ